MARFDVAIIAAKPTNRKAVMRPKNACVAVMAMVFVPESMPFVYIMWERIAANQINSFSMV